MVISPCAEPDFVGSALVRESSGSKDGDDDKIYFFFSERALELECETELTVARVARVCKVPTSSCLSAFPKLFKGTLTAGNTKGAFHCSFSMSFLRAFKVGSIDLFKQFTAQNWLNQTRGKRSHHSINYSWKY